MSSAHTITPTARTWRDIQQNIAPRAMSNEGRKRLVLATMKTAVTLLVLCVCAWGAYEIFHLWEENPTRLKAPVKGEPVRMVTLRTDGVLDHAWVVRTLALPKTVSLMELDLQMLRGRLLESGQVRTAVLSRKFPDTLAVVIEERLPVARMKVQVGNREPETLLVARDGVVFAGICQSEKLVESLPYLDGVALRRARSGFLPIEGMSIVADLLGTARANVPKIYGSWSIVSLARLASDGEIIVRSSLVPQITFGLREDFYLQLAQLDLIIDDASRHAGRPPLRSVNLAVGGNQVPVAFELIQPVGTERRGPASTPSSLSPASRPETQPLRTAPRRPELFPNLQRNSHRDV